LLWCESGASASEYAMILAVVGSALAAASLFLGNAVAVAINDAATCLDTNGATC
jgi:pilus assembly protein Flp/PilA